MGSEHTAPRLMALLALGLCGGSALAYELTGVSWTWQDHPFEDPIVLDADAFPAEDVDAGEVEDRVSEAMDSWNDLGLDLVLPYGGTGDWAYGADGHWNMFWYDSAGSSGYGSALAFASTSSWEDGAGNDCDIVFLSENDYGGITWSSEAGGASGSDIDIEAVALHELGHCIGLDHSSSSSAVMYAYYQGYRELSSDDIDGAEAMYGAPCVDGDGDGFSDCDLDCDDSDAATNPGATEVCDGVDNNCDGVVDNGVELTIETVDGTTSGASQGWTSLGTAFRADAPTMLVRASQHFKADEGTRLAWTVYRSDDGADWEMVRTARGEASTDAWQESPDLYIPLEEGVVYEVALGVFADSGTFYFDSSPPLEAAGPITVLGYTGGRALGDAPIEVDPTYSMDQELTLVDLEDADADGMTETCGDCDPDDPETHEDAEELCDGVDNDCDGEIDEDWATDSDGDGVYDCLDECPEDADDDSDGDGVCDSEDECPDDPDDTCNETEDDTGGGDTSGSGEGGGEGGGGTGGAREPVETGGDCGCAATTPAGGAWILLALAGLVRRRR